jgi:hypothetical protein
MIKRFSQESKCAVIKQEDKPYRWLSLALLTVAIMVTPFTSSYLIFIPFVIQLYRLFKYDVSSTCVDIALIMSFSSIYRAPGGDSLLDYFVLIMDLMVLFKKRTFKCYSVLCLLMIVSIYFGLHTGSKYTYLIFISGGLLFLYLMLCNQMLMRKVQIIGSFILGTLLSSVYAYVFRENMGVPFVV